MVNKTRARRTKIELPLSLSLSLSSQGTIRSLCGPESGIVCCPGVLISAREIAER